jgi:hypothetical protein
MYKGASRFRQHLSDEGRKLDGTPRGGSRPGEPKTARAKRLEAVAQEAKLKSWAAYVRKCRECNVEPRVPEAVLVELRRRGLIP